MAYEPLPDGLTIQKSSIEGQGVFTNKIIEKDTDLGLSHIVVDDEIIRTPLGGFINHSDEPNCIKVKAGGSMLSKRRSFYSYGDRYSLFTLRNIKAWEELTVKYTFYKVTRL